MKREEANVRRSTLRFLEGKSDWYNTEEITKEIGIGCEDDIYISTDTNPFALVNALASVYSGIGTVQKTDF